MGQVGVQRIQQQDIERAAGVVACGIAVNVFRQFRQGHRHAAGRQSVWLLKIKYPDLLFLAALKHCEIIALEIGHGAVFVRGHHVHHHQPRNALEHRGGFIHRSGLLF